ncbi:MAG: vWA domain-containing protein [Thermoguttaceae bacterium]|jgi:hypothetical protein
MNEPENHYKDKMFFWKWKRRKRTPLATAEGDQTAEKASFWTSWCGSLLIHSAILFFLVSAFELHTTRSRGVRGLPDGEVQFLFTDEEAGGGDGLPSELITSEGDEPVEEADPSKTTESETEQVSDQATEQVIGTGSASGTIAHVRFAPSSSGEGEGGKGEGRGGYATAGSGSGQAVRFGELQGRGRRFVYLLDRSESMKWPDEAPMRFAVAEARQSIASLDPARGAQKFQLIVFNHHEESFDGGKRLVDVTPEAQRRADEFLRALTPEGGTDPLEALSAAIRMAPDVIFFLTDAEEEISTLTLGRIRDMVRRAGVAQIHVIEFGKPSGKHPAAYRKLAQQNGGVYVYKDVTDLEPRLSE